MVRIEVHVPDRVVHVVSYLHWIANTVFKLDVLATRVLLPVKVTAYPRAIPFVLAWLPRFDIVISPTHARRFPNGCPLG